jgi:phosphotransferase system HPr-like phosphotransfer protein
MADGRSILSSLSLAAECGTMLALEAQGCDAEDAVAALANLMSETDGSPRIPEIQ